MPGSAEGFWVSRASKSRNPPDRLARQAESSPAVGGLFRPGKPGGFRGIAFATAGTQKHQSTTDDKGPWGMLPHDEIGASSMMLSEMQYMVHAVAAVFLSGLVAVWCILLCEAIDDFQ